MPGKRRYSGPLMRGQKSVRRRPKKGGFNKVEKKQATTIAKRVLNSASETKYFNTATALHNAVPNLAWWSSGTVKSEVSVYGYSTGYNRQVIRDDLDGLVRYGQSTTDGTDMTVSSLDLNKIFVAGENSIDGHSIRPSFNEVKWSLTYMGATTDSNPYGAAPVQVRVIRCVPRSRKGAAEVINPQEDLFLNQYNEPFGVQTKEGAAFTFDREQMRMAKANSRRYIIKEDKMFIMYPSSTFSSVATQTTDSQLVSTLNNGYRLMTTKHNLGKELYYESPAGTSSKDQLPDTGFQPEYIFYHLCSVGDARNVNSVVAPSNFRLSVRPVSGFKDL